jgi:PAS domain S-box-containing protein
MAQAINQPQVVVDLYPLFAAASLGDFSKDVNIPQQENEFIPLYVGVQVMVDVIREKIAELEQANRDVSLQLNKTFSQLTSIGEGIVTLDEEGVIRFLNPAGEKLLGLSDGEYLGRKWVDAVPLETETGEVIESQLRPFEDSAAFSSEGFIGNHLYYRRKDESRFPVTTTVSPLFFEGNRTGHIIAFRDISRELQLEQLKDDFLSIAAHELRTPLSTMRWTMESLMKLSQEDLPEAVRPKIKDLYNNNLILISLVNDILSVSRLSEQKIEDSKIIFDAKESIEEIVKELEMDAQQKKVQVKIEVKEGSATQLQMDKRHVGQVLRNLISNAIKYSFENGEVLISINQDTQNRQLCFEVIDKGMGIPQADKPHIYKRFFRGSNVSNSQILGTGLGLFVVKSYVDHWRGRLSFTSEEGKGTTFHLCLPQKIDAT